MKMLGYAVLLGAAISSSPVGAQVDKELECGISAADATGKLSKMFQHLDEVSRPAMTFGKLDDKVVSQICNAAQSAIQQATSLKNTPLANGSCSNAEVRKSADATIELAKLLIDEQKCP